MRSSNSARSSAAASVTKRTASRRTSATTSSPATAKALAGSHHAANAPRGSVAGHASSPKRSHDTRRR
jgi:hypothetical protein